MPLVARGPGFRQQNRKVIKILS